MQLQNAGSRPVVRGKLSVAQKRALSRGYLFRTRPSTPTARPRRLGAPQRSLRGAAPSPRSPAFDGAPLRSWQGIDDGSHSPTDSTGTIGTSRYIELVNSEVAFYDRTNDAPLSVGTLAALAGETGNLFDPQMIWDPGTNRFYYVMDNIVSSTDNRLEVGFSTTATPNSTADFCKYVVSTGAEFYDYPKLGDSSNLWMVGANVFNSGGSVPAQRRGRAHEAGGGQHLSGGHLVHADDQEEPAPRQRHPSLHAGPGQPDRHQRHGLDRVGRVRFRQLPVRVPGDEERQQPDGRRCGQDGVGGVLHHAGQRGAEGEHHKLDSSDTRLTNAVSAIDPSQSAGTSVAIWTQHTVFGGPGAEVRWYEINPAPATPVPFQNGTAGSSALFAFNGAIAPDRRVNGASAMFGSSMVLGFNTSSSTQFINIMAVSKRGTHGQTGQEVIKAGTVPETDFTCAGGTCRSGDYGGASPDPASDTTKSDGVVWQTNQFPGTDWHTWNFAGRPSPAPK